MSNGNNVSTSTKLSDVPEFKQRYIPKSTYRHKVVDVAFGNSKSTNNPMFTLTCEITGHPGFPDPKNPGEVIDPNGTQADVYMSLTDKAAGNVRKMFKAMGLPLDVSIDDLKANPNPELFRGREFLAMGYSKPDVQIDEITKQPLKNPVTGQDIIYYRYQIGEVFA
jgi:hypothetical protein